MTPPIPAPAQADDGARYHVEDLRETAKRVGSHRAATNCLDAAAFIERQAAALTEAHAECGRLRGALRVCAEVFDHYVELHADKGTHEGNAKAATNRKHAEMCRAALGVPNLENPDVEA